MATITESIEFDIINPNPDIVLFMQHRGYGFYQIELSLFADGVPWEPNAGITVTHSIVYYRRTGDTENLYANAYSYVDSNPAVQISGSTMTVLIHDNVLRNAGTAYIQVALTYTQTDYTTLINLFPIKIEVVPLICDDEFDPWGG